MTLTAFRNAVDNGRPLIDDRPLFSSAQWLVPWLDHYARRSDQFPGNTEEPLPMMIRRRRLSGVPLRELRFVASGDEAGDEVCTEFADLASTEVASFDAMLASAAWDLCSIENVSADSVISNVMRRAGAFACPAGMRYRVPLPASVADWEAMLGKSSRAKVRRTRRDMHAQSLQLQHAHGAEALALLPTLVDLHQARWQSRGHAGVFASARFLAFHQQLLGQPDSPAHIAVLRRGTEAVAAWYGLDHHGSRYFYQSGFTVPDHGHFSPGMAMHLCMIESAIASGMQWYDFMKGADQSYKSGYGAETSPMWHWRLPGPTFRGRLIRLGLLRSRHWHTQTELN